MRREGRRKEERGKRLKSSKTVRCVYQVPTMNVIFMYGKHVSNKKRGQGPDIVSKIIPSQTHQKCTTNLLDISQANQVGGPD